MKKENNESANAPKGQVVNITTSSDASLIAEIVHYTVEGAMGHSLDDGYEVCLIANDDSIQNEVLVTLNPAQARCLAMVLETMAREADVKNGNTF